MPNEDDTAELRLPRADLGQPAEVSENAKLDTQSAASWELRRKATLAENEARRERRYGCLRDSAMVGGGAGTIGATASWQMMQKRSTGPFRTLLGINVSAKEIGGGMRAFTVFVGFFMPFMFVSNVVRWRCQKDGLQRYRPPSIGEE